MTIDKFKEGQSNDQTQEPGVQLLGYLVKAHPDLLKMLILREHMDNMLFSHDDHGT